jgi:hypothetical protein
MAFGDSGGRGSGSGGSRRRFMAFNNHLTKRHLPTKGLEQLSALGEDYVHDQDAHPAGAFGQIFRVYRFFAFGRVFLFLGLARANR